MSGDFENEAIFANGKFNMALGNHCLCHLVPYYNIEVKYSS